MDILKYIDDTIQTYSPEEIKNFNKGGSVTTPKRGLVDEAGSYAGRKISSKKRLNQLNEAAKKYGYDSYKDVPTGPEYQKERNNIREWADRRAKGVLTKEELYAVRGDRIRLEKFNNDPRVQQLRWINDNAKKYKNPKIMIKAFEKRFNVKDYRNAVLFKDAMITGSEATNNLAKYIDLSILEFGKDPLKTKSATKTFTFRPGVTEDALFKSAIIQKNKSAYEDFATALKNIDSDLASLRSKGIQGKLTIEETLNLLNKKDYDVLNNFGFIKAEKGRSFRPYMTGLFKDSVESQNLNMNHFSSFKSLITPLTYIETIISNLSNPSIAKEFGLNALEVKKVQKGWENVSKGQAQAAQWVDNLETKIGSSKFRNLFGKVIFEHQLAKKFGKNWKFLPRDYLLRGQMANEAFNAMKLKTYDSPMANLISQYEKASKAGNTKQATILMSKIENLHREFNRITDNYMKDYTPSFKGGKFEWKSDVKPFSKEILHRYDNPAIGGKELEKITLGMKNLGTASEDVFSKKQISSIKKYTEKQDKLKNLIKKLGYKCAKSGGGEEDLACYMKDVMQTKEDLKSNDPIIRAKALTKQRKAANAAKKIPELFSLFRKGLQGTLGTIGGPAGAVVEGLIEAGTYDYFRRKGYTHKQASAETFFGKIFGLGDLKKEEGRSPFEDATKLLEKEIAGKDPAKLRYLDNLKKQEEIYNEIASLEAASSGEQYLKPEQSENLKNKLKLKLTELTELENKIKPGSPDYEAWKEAEERQQNKAGIRAEEYKKESRLFPETEEESEKRMSILNAPKRLQEQRKYLTGTIEPGAERIPSMLQFEPGELDEMAGDLDKWGLIYDARIGGLDLLDKIGIAGGVSKMASGGIASLTTTIPPKRGPNHQGLASLKKYGKQY